MIQSLFIKLHSAILSSSSLVKEMTYVMTGGESGGRGFISK